MVSHEMQANVANTSKNAVDMPNFIRSSTPKNDLKRLLQDHKVNLIIPGPAKDALTYVRRMRVYLSRAKTGLKNKAKNIPQFKTKLTYLREGTNETWLTLELRTVNDTISAEIELMMEKLIPPVTQIEEEETVNE